MISFVLNCLMIRSKELEKRQSLRRGETVTKSTVWVRYRQL